MKSVVLIATLVFTILLATAFSQDDSGGKNDTEENAKMDFNCLRSGSVCAGDNSTCSDSGTCECEDGREGYSCQIFTDNKTDCKKVCGNGGTCYKDENGDEKCACVENRYGDTCARKRVFHDCNHDMIEININPASDDNFKGVIYVRGQENDDDCIFETATKVGWNGYQGNIGLQSCGGAKNETDDEGNNVLSFEVVVQYNKFFLFTLDQNFIFTCVHRKSGGDIEWSATPVNPDTEYKMPGGEVKEELIPIKLEMLDKDGNPISNDDFQKIGEILTMRFTLEGGKEYSAFRIEAITASNGVKGKKHLSQDFVKDGCVQQELVDSDVVIDFSGDPSKYIDLKFKVFKFLYSSTIDFRAKATLCKDKGECEIIDCDFDKFEGLGRKKRDLRAVLGQNEEEMGTRLYIWYPTGRVDVKHFPDASHPDSTASLQDCVQNTAFIILVAGIMFFLVLFITVMFCLYVRSRPARYVHDLSGSNDNMTFQKPSTHF